jgi:hypothetical protein
MKEPIYTQDDLDKALATRENFIERAILHNIDQHWETCSDHSLVSLMKSNSAASNVMEVFAWLKIFR